ncbi:MAG: response regulator [Lachnospiraceae bacterium]|nr:response regulator [Lachnospiraceae bacterium]
MEGNNNSNFIRPAIIGGVLFALIMVCGTIWTGRSAGVDSLEAVRKVSVLFMGEMTERREQVVASTLEDYIDDLDIAVGLIERSDLESVETLQSYQARMKQLYDLERFAFVDEDGLIYTSRGTRTDIDSYGFDYKNISGPEISVRHIDKDDKKLVIAIPIDRLPLGDKHLDVCFMEMDMDKMLERISFEGSSNSITFCNIYTKDGVALTNTVLGGLASEDNLLDALAAADYEFGYSNDKVVSDFKEARTGEVSFTYNGITETLYYIPVRNTDWMLTYLIRESVISDEIGAISDGIIRRSMVLSVLVAAAMLAVFVVAFIQSRKASALRLERETAEAENRVRQEELEEQLALQEELLEQEKQRAQQDRMITALASDYRSVYYVDLDTDEGFCYRKSGAVDIDVKGQFDFSAEFTKYAVDYVDEKYRDDFLNFIKPENISAALARDVIIACRYLVRRGGRESYEMLRMAGVRQPDEREDGRIHAIGVGFSDIDEEMRDSMARSQALSDALAAAEEASKAKTVFLSNMSHEIRTPMNAIIGLDSLALHEEGLSDAARDYLEKIGTSAQHLLSLINDILDMSRIESGRMVIKNEEFSFPKLMEQINTIFSGQCAEKGIEYNCHVGGALDDYYIGDSIKLRQVMINILGNAVKFTPEGGNVDFDVEKLAAFDDKSTLRFKITDTGIGMSKEYLPKLFDTFSQEDSTASNKYGSSGLGMAITKSIVEMMNGNIEVESEKGKGTTFTVTLTLLDSDRKDTGAADIEIRPQEMSVLVIDDDEVACEHAKLLLQTAGIATETATSGTKALEMVRLRHARRDPYNLIIVDWQMPEMDGVETTRAIRSEIGDESAIIILTAYNWDDILDEALAAGVDSFISKPLFTSNLLDEFKSAMKKKMAEIPTEKKKAELAGKRILIAEDMAVNAQIMMKVLKMRDMESELADNGRKALDMFAASEVGYYDAILMDMRMPEMTGIEATVAIRALDRADAKTVPIIALTANAFDEDVQRSLQAGLNAHLSKPIQPDLLFETLEGML